MDLQEFQRIRASADDLFTKGKLRNALDAYESIKEYARTDPKLLMRVGDIHRKLGNDQAAIEEYQGALKSYAKGGFIVKAIAICKLILSINPSQRNIERSLVELYAQRSRDEAEAFFDRTPPEGGAYETDVPLGAPAGADAGFAEDSGEPPIEPVALDEIESISPLQNDEVVSGEGLAHDEGPEERPEAGRHDITVEFEEDWVEDDLSSGTAGRVEPVARSMEAGEGLRTPLFSDLNPVELAEVIKGLKARSVGMGDYVYRAGEIGKSIFVVTSGAAEEIGRTKYGEEIKCANHMDGDFFGEDAYFSGLQRKTDLMAVTDMELLEIEKEEMEKIAAVHPHVSEVLSGFYKERVLERVLATSKVFRHLAETDRRGLIELASVEHCETGSDMVREGVPDDEKMYIIASGAAEVWRRGPAGSKRPLARLLTSDYFGEVALMLSKPRTATVTALSPMDLIAFSRESLSGVFARYPIVKKVLENMAKKHLKESGNQ
jgi:cAMP-dependent protein kinase regulator